ncbi:error-prone DNA polymerase [Aquincola tertiaricarbonis]|uniref:Error-prone DNA polymerase n=1 Tax=Aquincola tertiaricarbonis TaxID=391953 RepID=A0ABY4SJE6_AQUTE|nr:error-prone DNA polymerase [Aquincola tertiaricarbonis]URI11958.1 error-prone DNA polymerase [Aquincola tertiaricarbonis]
MPGYAELHCRSNFSFLTGASHPGELVARAAQLGYAALAITDECSVAGVVRAHEELKRQHSEAGSALKLIIGSQFEVEGEGDTPGCRLVLLAHNREGYGDLCELITLGRLRADKGQYRLTVRDFEADGGARCPTPRPPRHLRGLHRLPDCTALLIPRRDEAPAQLLAQADWLRRHFEFPAIAVELLMHADDSLLAERLQAVSAATGVALVAAGDVLMHVRSRKPLQDTLTAIRLKTPVAECGLALARNAEQHLRSRLRLAQLYRPEWLGATLAIAARCVFRLDELRYEYPAEIVPPGMEPIDHLRALTAQGLQERYGPQAPPGVQAQVARELALIQELKYEAFFLTVHDVVRFARSRGILCQGRGSAANSAVCFALGITEVDPTKTTLLFERFISRERDEPPDIDVDFEHERREEVIQYIYRKYGTERTALAAALATYRTRGSVRDVGKALGIDATQVDALARSFQWFDDRSRMAASVAEAGLRMDSPVTRRWIELVDTLRGFPRHLSQHTGGFVIARDKLSRLVPIENAAMVDRRVIQWDKDDLESLGLLKVDVLALGMLTALRRALDLLGAWQGRRWRLQDIPQDCSTTYDMICRADTVGVFQIESRAQQSMLPRLKPRRLYDLVIEVAIVRPGPIQGGMVHPYLQRREQLAAGQLPPSRYPALDDALGRTLGVPIFQEQVMQICMIAAGFSAGEADQLRRAMAAWRRDGQVDRFEHRIVQGMTDRGYDEDFAKAIFKQICGFGEYGFPESHAFSFAILAYFSCWLKCHHPAIFLAAMLNSQPMGFYPPSQLVQDARRHDVEVRPVDVLHSHWDCTLEARSDSGRAPAVRLGLRLVSAMQEEAARRIVQAREQQPPADVDDLARRAGLDARLLQALARADALRGLAGHRRQQLWAAAGQAPARALLADAPVREAAHEQPQLPLAPEGEDILLDYAATGLTLRRHPVALLRGRLQGRGWLSAEELGRLRGGARAWACGIVTMRQQPETAKGTIFVTLEDETGSVNVIVWKHIRERQRNALLRSRLLAVAGEWQVSADGVRNMVARRLVDVTPWLGGLSTSSRDFH